MCSHVCIVLINELKQDLVFSHLAVTLQMRINEQGHYLAVLSSGCDAMNTSVCTKNMRSKSLPCHLAVTSPMHQCDVH